MSLPHRIWCLETVTRRLVSPSETLYALEKSNIHFVPHTMTPKHHQWNLAVTQLYSDVTSLQGCVLEDWIPQAFSVLSLYIFVWFNKLLLSYSLTPEHQRGNLAATQLHRDVTPFQGCVLEDRIS